ncbi:amino acid ABC transporter substrate-binding protein [Roseomonas sp. NAR14]|uniref:Amino acid ABC transporter substrate-binding protein n=1 Tax=Roseomonas acroporae TaxID=2937791 RepID=A0A9X1YBM0_9PROT|nr:amino acid ABC transporter substrate-binding protein [Roseomonas acroporae]MCK8785975.1 amino acid ABC transporter substrate-binding protein [Roseomonas acroporae]
MSAVPAVSPAAAPAAAMPATGPALAMRRMGRALAGRARGLGAALIWTIAWTIPWALALPTAPARAQDASPSAGSPATLSGTLREAAARGSLRLGYRESSLPFSFLDARRQPVGYSIDLCLAVVAAAREALGRDLAVEWRPVTPASRIPALLGGLIDLECGSTTSNAERERQVAFSPIIFVAGTRLMVPRGSPVRRFADLAGRNVVVTAGTTNAEALRSLAERQRIPINLVAAPDHAQSFARLVAGEVDAFATDDVLLQGLLATSPEGDRFRVAGPLLSYEPYGLMFRRGDPTMADLVTRTFARLAASGELGDIYDRWFTRRLPGGELLNLPMGPQLTELFRMLGAPD